MTGALWTGIDLFMGFVIGPVLRRVSLETRRAMIAGIIPRTLILMPTLSTITSTAGWFLAVRMGFLDLGYPQFWWVIAALAIVTVLTVQGLGYLLPMNLKLYFEILKDTPDPDKLKRWMRTYVRVVGGAGHHAGRHHRRYGALRHRVLTLERADRPCHANPMRSISGAALRSSPSSSTTSPACSMRDTRWSIISISDAADLFVFLAGWSLRLMADGGGRQHADARRDAAPVRPRARALRRAGADHHAGHRHAGDERDRSSTIRCCSNGTTPPPCSTIRCRRISGSPCSPISSAISTSCRFTSC